MAMQFIKTLLHILPVQCTFSAASVRTAYNWSKLPNGTNSALLGYKCQDIEFILGLKMSTEISMRSSNQMYIPYAHHCGLYIFYPIFENHLLVFKEVFSDNSILMYGYYSRAGYDGTHTVIVTARQ